MASRGVVKFKKNWIDDVEPGTPFSLVFGDKAEEKVSKRRILPPSRKGPSISQRVRRLEEMGELFTPEEVAAKLKVSKWTVYDWVYDKKLRATYVGRNIRIAKADLEEYLNA